MKAGILPPALKSIEQLFISDARYMVPKYQRSFAWGADEIEELWEDLLSAMTRKSEYFVGTIVLHKKTQGPQEIIDGQQRLACISMIFSAIRNVFMASHDDRAEHLFIAFLGGKDFTRDAPLSPKLMLNNINNEVYLERVVASQNLEEIDAALKDKGLHNSNKLLLQAYRYFLGKITSEVSNKGTQADDFIVPLIDCLRDSVKIITIPVTSEEDANLFFESLNARGKELAVSDLVKNRLYLEARNQVIRAQGLWEAMESELGRRPVPEFLRHFWIAKKIEVGVGTVREKALYRMVAAEVRGKQTATIKLLKEFSASAADYARISDYTLWPDDDAYDSSFEQTLNDLRLFRVTQCNPILLNAIQKFRKPKDVAKIFRTVSNFSFRYFIIGNQSPGNLERASNAIAVGIREGVHSTPSEVADAFRGVNPDANFRSAFGLASMVKASAKLARYTLLKITNFMSGEKEKVANPDSKEVTLEHVLPQSPTPKWLPFMSTGVDAKDYIYRIGNLTLLTAKVNHDAANDSFADKQRLALNDSTLAINQAFRGLKKWGDKEIEGRQAELAKVALQVWKL